MLVAVHIILSLKTKVTAEAVKQNENESHFLKFYRVCFRNILQTTCPQLYESIKATLDTLTDGRFSLNQKIFAGKSQRNAFHPPTLQQYRPGPRVSFISLVFGSLACLPLYTVNLNLY